MGARTLASLTGLFLFSLSAVAAPSKDGGPGSPPDVRTIECYAKPIIISKWPDGRLEVVDENVRSRYLSDADSEAYRIEKNPDGSLSYSDHHRGAITISGDGDRTTVLPQLNLTILREQRAQLVRPELQTPQVRPAQPGTITTTTVRREPLAPSRNSTTTLYWDP
jgi:hypothetical protein